MIFFICTTNMKKLHRLIYFSLSSTRYSNTFSKSIYNEYQEYAIWRPSSLSELTLIISYMELTYLGSEASIFYKNKQLIFCVRSFGVLQGKVT